MQLTKLKLVNYCQYANREIVFAKGVSVLRGRNGSGKSNLLNAIFFALTGDSVIEGKTRAKMLKWGTKKGNVTLTFKHNGGEYIITRALQASVTTLQGPDNLKLNKSNESSEYIEKLLGADADLLKLTSFMPQIATNKLILGTNAERQKAFGRLFRLSHLEKGRQDLLKAYNEIPMYEEVNEDIEKITREILNNQEEHTAVTDKAETQRSYLESCKEVYEKMKEDRNKTEKKIYDDIIKQKRDNIARLLESKEQATSKINSIPKHVDSPVNASRDYDRYVNAKAFSNNFINKVTELDAANAEYEKNITKPTGGFYDLDDINEGINNNEQLISKLRIEIYNLKKSLELWAKGECDKCGTKFVDNKDKGVFIEENIKNGKIMLIAKEDDLNQAIKLIAWEKQMSVYMRDQQSLLNNMSNNVAKDSDEIESHTKIIDEFNLPEYLELQEALKSNKKYDEERDSWSKVIDKLDRDIKDQETDLIRAEATPVRSENYSEEYLLDYEKKYQEYHQLNQQLIKLKTLIEGNKLRLKDKETTQQKGLLANKQRKFIEQCREVLHVSGYPKVASSIYKNKLAKILNKYLVIFEQPFTVYIDNNLAFLCKFADNDAVPANELSGGQKGMLSISCRLGIAEMLSSDVEALTFDEPGAAMDVEAKEGMCEAFAQVRSYLNSNNIQTIISSHDTAIETIAEGIINVGD